jgi:glutamate-5-semialdehyde dehydrogenase
MITVKSEVLKKAQAAKEASRKLALVSTATKNKALDAMAEAVVRGSSLVVRQNQIDLKNGAKKGLSKALLDRLELTDQRIKSMIDGLKIVKDLPDPIGEIISSWTRPNGLKISKVRVPFGVIGIIYESRPNVTVDAAALCLKTGNAVILRGGTDAINSNKILAKLMAEAAYSAGIPQGSIQLIETLDRSAVGELLKLNKYLDLVIPRGGAGLIRRVVAESTVPVIETGVGNCHVYVEASADLAMAEKIILNAKCQRPSVCNAAETLLIDEKVDKTFVRSVLSKLKAAGVEIRACKKIKALDSSVKTATEADWVSEYLDLIMAVKMVKGIDEAIAHITKYGTQHTEAIISKDKKKIEKFKKEVDAAAIMVNTSTRFTDGFEFGFGAEIGISTQKMHARGPMGLPELTSYKYVVEGSGQIRT